MLQDLRLKVVLTACILIGCGLFAIPVATGMIPFYSGYVIMIFVIFGGAVVSFRFPKDLREYLVKVYALGATMIFLASSRNIFFSIFPFHY